uniref:PpnK_1 protein n=1 Tax=Fopius arisanus TaxID=64838 RepID=A0A0C9RZ37_9HYME
MWYLLPVTCCLALFHTVTSRTEPLDFTKIDRQNEMLIPSESMTQPKDLTSLKLLPQRLQEIDSDGASDLQNWNRIGRYNPQVSTGENTPLDGIDTAVFDQLDDTVPEDFEEVKLNGLSTYLSSLLRQPSWNTPLIILEDPGIPEDLQGDMDIRPILKRSRYNNRYTWKRQNGRSRNTYDYDSAHLCTPSREDVYQLLVALHDVRQGNKSRTVQYCNRRRPVNTVFTNIRFLGRRK